MKTAIKAGFIALLFFSAPSWAAYSCNISTASVGVLYTAANVDTNGSVTLTCTRDALDLPSLTYRIKADDGANAFATAPFRRTRLGATPNVLRYILRRGTVVGGAAACGNTTTWRAPATGIANVIQGTLAFGASLSTTVVWGYCIRIRGTAGGNPAAPAAGSYTDSFNVFAQYPNNDAGALSPLVPATYTVGVTNQCVFNTFPTSMAFNYTSFSATPQVQTRPFDLRCSNALPWSLAIAPASSVLLGLTYNITASPASGTGTGADQVITLTGTIPANQAGTCTGSSCTATQGHVVTITY
jgi:hypothetical protein